MSDVVERPMFRRRLNSTPAWIGHRAPDGFTEVRPDQSYRYDPAYFTYYYSLRPLDPRLAPPLFKSHFPNYEQPDVSGVYCEDLQIAPYRPKEVDYVYTNVPVVTEHDVHALDAYVPPVCTQDEIEPNQVLSEMCEQVKTDSSSCIGAGLLGFHLSHSLHKEVETCKTLDSEAPSASCPGSEEYADEDLDTQSCRTTEALSLVSERSNESNKPTKKSKDKINRIPQRILPLVPTMEAGRVQWLLAPIPEACGTVQCSVWRDKKLLNSRYVLNLEMPPTPNVVADSFGREFLDGNVQKATQQFMCAGKRIGRGVYLISADKDDFDKKGSNYVAKCRRNLTNHDFTILAAKCAKKRKDKRGTTKRELAAVDFVPSNKNTPAQIQAILPDHTEDPATTSTDSEEWLLNSFNNGMCVNDTIMKNTQPAWNKRSKSYEIDFGGRVKMPSVKNMQLQNVAVNPKPVCLTFGKVEDNHFVLDFAYPLSVVQAFGIALAAFDAL